MNQPTNSNHMNSPVFQYCLLFLTATAATVGLIYMRTILVPFVFSIFFFALASPVVKWLQKRARFPRWLAVSTVFLGMSLICSGLMVIIASSLGDFATSADTYKARIGDFVTYSMDNLSRFKMYGIKIDKNSVLEQLKSLPFFTFLQTLTSGVASLFANAFLILVFLFFLLAGENIKRTPNPILDEVLKKISHYLLIKSLLSLATGVGVGVILLSFGVELAVLMGFLTFLLNFIPNIGFLISTVLPLPLILIEHGFGVRFLGVFILSLLVQLIMGNFLEPRYIGESMDLHPVTILVFLMFWGLIWGGAGMFLAVPITAILKIALSRFPTTRPLAELLAGRF